MQNLFFFIDRFLFSHFFSHFLLSLWTDPFLHPWPLTCHWKRRYGFLLFVKDHCALPLQSLMLLPYVSPVFSSQSGIGPGRPGSPAFNTTLYEISMQMTHFVFSVNHHCKCQAHYSQILQGVVTSISSSGEGRFLKGAAFHKKRLLSDYAAGDMNFLVTFYLIQLKTDSCINPIHPSALHINKTGDQEKRKLQRKLGKKNRDAPSQHPVVVPRDRYAILGLLCAFVMVEVVRGCRIWCWDVASCVTMVLEKETTLSKPSRL